MTEPLDEVSRWRNQAAAYKAETVRLRADLFLAEQQLERLRGTVAGDPSSVVYVALRQVWARLGPIEANRPFAAYLADRLLELGCEIAGVRRLTLDKEAS